MTDVLFVALALVCALGLYLVAVLGGGALASWLLRDKEPVDLRHDELWQRAQRERWERYQRQRKGMRP